MLGQSITRHDVCSQGTSGMMNRSFSQLDRGGKNISRLYRYMDELRWGHDVPPRAAESTTLDEKNTEAYHFTN